MKVYSFCLFGERFPYFMKFLPSIIRAFYCLYDFNENWRIVIYHDSKCMNHPYFKTLKRMEERNLLFLVHFEENHPLAKSMLVRMKSLWNPDIEVSVFRDLDYLPSYRERQMIEVFLNSKCFFHACSDHECHVIPLMGGMISSKNKELIDFLKISSWEEFVSKENEEFFSLYGKDQEYMNNHYWSILKPITCEHRIEGMKTQNCLESYSFIEDIQIPFINDNIKKVSNSFVGTIGGYSGDKEREECLIFYENNLPENIRNLIIDAEDFI